MDARLKLLSHSTICSLHTCPRKMQLTKICPEAKRESSPDLAFGSMFGAGIQALLAGSTLQEAVIESFPFWNIELDEVKSNKSVWTCIAALEQFSLTKHLGELSQYEVAIFNGKSALELSFCITLPGGYYYRGYVDCVLRHKLTGQYLVVDIKTTGQNSSNPAKYQNSPQCLGYSIIMDSIDPANSSYEVMYYEYMTYTKKFVAHSFVLANLARAKWLRNLLTDIAIMEMYDQDSDWPMHGESCSAYSRACQFIDICTMETSSICPVESFPFPDMHSVDARLLDTKTDLNDKGLKVKKIVEYDVMVSFEELVNNQISKL